VVVAFGFNYRREFIGKLNYNPHFGQDRVTSLMIHKTWKCLSHFPIYSCMAVVPNCFQVATGGADVRS
jgi:hypothetical protein